MRETLFLNEGALVDEMLVIKLRDGRKVTGKIASIKLILNSSEEVSLKEAEEIEILPKTKKAYKAELRLSSERIDNAF